ncbi:MAG: hypothetical protein LBL62_03850 [Planctomycetaceae bacterium]|nr:hypothetical protein [Planctomycetaceae bacterium]
MNQINNGNWYCQWFWNPITKRNQGQVGYRRRNRSANGCPPYNCLLLTKIPLKYYVKYNMAN